MLINSLMQKAADRFFIFIFLTALLSAAACDILSGPSISDTPPQIEQKIFNLVNDHRRSIGLNELAWSDAIAEQARLHSQSMAAGKVPFGHDGFDDRIALIAETIPWQSAGEVVALAATAAAAVDGWLASAEHKPLLEGSFGWTGIGVAKSKSGSSLYATQIFIKPR